MQVLILVQDWISFYNQAEALALGLGQKGINHKLVLLTEVEKSDKIYNEYKPDVVVGVGSWHKYKEFVERPMSLGYKVLPWIVSDDKIEDFVEGYNNLKLILTTSYYCETVFIRDGIKPDKLKIMYEAVDPEFWNKTSNESEEKFLRMLSVESNFEISKKFDLVKAKKDGIPLILTMGGDVTSKGAQEIIRALARLDKNLEWYYIMKAWPQKHTFVRGQEEFDLISKFGLEDRVKYMVVDFSKEFVRDLINICDIYAAPSRGEGFGLPIVQAQMCGKPIVSVEALSIVDVVEKDKTGFLAKPTMEDGLLKADIDDLTKYLDKLIRDKNLRLEMGKRGRRSTIKKFAPTKIAEQLIGYIRMI